MACPWFYPLEAMDAQQWPNPPRLPLGDPYAGECRARDGAPRTPDANSMRNLCNQGYARNSCAEFPDGNGPDAVRFGIAADNGEIVRIHFVVESGHLPHGQGAIQYSRDSRRFIPPLPEEILNRQAEAYLASYLRRKTRQV